MRKQFSLDKEQKLLVSQWFHEMPNLMRDVAGYTDFNEIVSNYSRALDIPYAEYLFNGIRPRFDSLLKHMHFDTGLDYKKLLETISRLCLLWYYETSTHGYPSSPGVISAINKICKRALLEYFPSLLREKEPDYDAYSNTLLIGERLSTGHKDILKAMLYHKWLILENYICQRETLYTTRNSMRSINSLVEKTIADIICYLAISFCVFKIRDEDKNILYTFWEQQSETKES